MSFNNSVAQVSSPPNCKVTKFGKLPMQFSQDISIKQEANQRYNKEKSQRDVFKVEAGPLQTGVHQRVTSEPTIYKA